MILAGIGRVVSHVAVQVRRLPLILCCLLWAQSIASAQGMPSLPITNLQGARAFWGGYDPGRLKLPVAEQQRLFCQLLEVYNNTPENELDSKDRLGHACAALRCSYLNPIERPLELEFVRQELVKFVDILRGYRAFQRGRQLHPSEREVEDGNHAAEQFRIAEQTFPLVYVLDITELAVGLSSHYANFGRVCGPSLAVIWDEALPLYPDPLQPVLRSRYQVFMDLDESDLTGPSLLYTAVRTLNEKLETADSIRDQQGVVQLGESLDEIYAQWVRGVEAITHKAGVLRVVEQFVNPLWESANRSVTGDAMCERSEYELRSQLARRACVSLRDAIRSSITRSVSTTPPEQLREVDRLRNKLLTMVLSWGWKQWDLAIRCPDVTQRLARYRDMAEFERQFLDDTGQSLLQEHQKFLHAQLAQVSVMLGDDAEAVLHRVQAGALLTDEALSRLRGLRNQVQ